MGNLDKPPHGGPRKGAGRPPSGRPRKVKTSLTIAPDLLADVEAEAARGGISRSELLEEGARLVLAARRAALAALAAGEGE
jgi:hypothetical protein